MKEKIKNIGLTTVSTIFCLVVLELILAYPVYYLKYGRTFYSMEFPLKVFEPHPDIGYVSTPNITVKRPVSYDIPDAPRRANTYDFQTDKHGFRYSGVLAKEKPQEEIRIFCLGGSTTASTGMGNNTTYPQQLEDMINDPQVRVINAGTGGYRSIHLVHLYKKKIRNLSPDIITIFSGWNDYEDFLYSYWKPKDPLGHVLLTQMLIDKIPFKEVALVYFTARVYYHYKNYSRTKITESDEWKLEKYIKEADNLKWQKEYKSNIQELIDLAKSDGVIPVLILYPSPQFRTTSREIKEFANHDLNMAGRWDAFVTQLQITRKIMRDLAKKNNIDIFDVNSEFDKFNTDFKKKFLFFIDRMHLSIAGNKLIAQAMLPSMQKTVNSVITSKE